jgi:hypothetical protein
LTNFRLLGDCLLWPRLLGFNFGKNLFGSHFGWFFHKRIWSPCRQVTDKTISCVYVGKFRLGSKFLLCPPSKNSFRVFSISRAQVLIVLDHLQFKASNNF